MELPACLVATTLVLLLYYTCSGSAPYAGVVLLIASLWTSTVYYLYVRGFDTPLVHIPFHLQFLPNILQEQFFKVMFLRSNSNGLVWNLQPGYIRSAGATEWYNKLSLYTHKEICLPLLEIWSRQLIWYSFFSAREHELLGPCIGLWIQWYLLKSQTSWLLNGGPLSTLTDTGVPSEAKVLSIFGITTLALVEVTNSTSAYLTSRLLAHYTLQILSNMDGGPKVYSNISWMLTGHGCHVQWLSLLWHAHHLA